jgi:hypothetical protein
MLKHREKQGVNILGLMHLKGVQELLIEKLGEQAVRDNYEFVVIRGKTLSDEEIRTFAKNIPIPALLLDSAEPSNQLEELLAKTGESSHLKMD